LKNKIIIWHLKPKPEKELVLKKQKTCITVRTCLLVFHKTERTFLLVLLVSDNANIEAMPALMCNMKERTIGIYTYAHKLSSKEQVK
jgi:hypothetical protein